MSAATSRLGKSGGASAALHMPLYALSSAHARPTVPQQCGRETNTRTEKISGCGYSHVKRTTNASSSLMLFAKSNTATSPSSDAVKQKCLR